MPIEEQRSLIEVGGKHRSSAITLPASWVRFWRLRKGQKLDVFADGALVIVPPNHPERDKIIEKIRSVLV